MSDDKEFNAWNTGMKTPVPHEYAMLSTVMRAENILNSHAEINELSTFLGLPKTEVALCRPERLILHETMVRVMADINIAEGEHYSDLGKNFRGVVRALLNNHVMPHMPELQTTYDNFTQNTANFVSSVLDETLFIRPQSTKTVEAKKGFLQRVFNIGAKSLPPTPEATQQDHINGFKSKYLSCEKSMERSVYKNLYKVANALLVKHGKIWNDKALIQKIVTNMVCNEYGSKVLGDKIDPYIRKGIEQENFIRIQEQDDPVVISLKGASAAGKSSLRMAMNKDPDDYLGDSGVETLEGFAMISPDICRKMLLDYDSLGPAYKYAGPLTADELVFIDRKVDRYLRDKIKTTGKMGNLLIDRFRFDTFSVYEHEGSSSFVSQAERLHMFFLVTGPKEIVERGWIRGLETGRYRATEDFLALCIEAYQGMPDKFFQWVDEQNQKFNYKFLNNDVPKGEPCLLGGFGDSDTMNIVDVQTFLDIVKNAKVNIYAQNPDEVFPVLDVLRPESNTDFILECIDRMPCVNFLDDEAGTPYARVKDGVPEVCNLAVFSRKMNDDAYAAVFKKAGFMKHWEIMKNNEANSPNL